MRLEIRSGSAEIFLGRAENDQKKEGRGAGVGKKRSAKDLVQNCFFYNFEWVRERLTFWWGSCFQVNGIESGSHREKRTLRCLDEYRGVFFPSSRFCD